MRIKKSRYNKLLNGSQKSITCSKECSNLIKQSGKNTICSNCGKTFYRIQSHINRQENQFCSVKCEQEFRHNKLFENRKCEICNNYFHISKSSNQRFCSRECQGKWQSQQTRELNPRFRQKLAKCEYCKKIIYVKNYKLESGQYNFCSSKCRQLWYSSFWCQQEEWKNKSRTRILKTLNDGKMSFTNSKPQQIIDKLLSELDIKYTKEYILDFYSIDNYLNDSNLMIEIQGDYWHGNPVRFNKKLNNTQIENIRKDKAKHTYIKNKYNIEILYLWENDIVNKLDVCKELIKLYINCNGILDNYHSINYIINNNGLELSKDIITPYQEMNKKDYINLLNP